MAAFVRCIFLYEFEMTALLFIFLLLFLNYCALAVLFHYISKCSSKWSVKLCKLPMCKHVFVFSADVQ